MGTGQEWATEDNELPYTPDLHISGTVKKPGSLTFWLTRRRPKDVSPDDWDAQEQARWKRIFGKKEAK